MRGGLGMSACLSLSSEEPGNRERGDEEWTSGVGVRSKREGAKKIDTEAEQGCKFRTIVRDSGGTGLGD